MFIKVLVDFSGILNAIFPYAVSLNPGLPTPLQQTMIRQEIEKRQQQESSHINKQ
jgi:hypothetical protein